MELNTRHFAILGASGMGIANIISQGSSEITMASIGVLSAAFVWDKIQSAIRKE